ncbi:MAG TPA: class I SAM-dependent methyltransferase [Patescibacteria group bacterium]
MMDFNERVIPNVSSNYLFKEALARYEFVKRFIKNGMRVIDLGCGTGYGSAVLSELGCEVTGIDIDKEAVDYATKHYGKKTKFIKGNIKDLRLKNSEFDIACSFEVIEHIDNPKAFLKEVKRIIKKGSYFILSTPNASVVSPHGGVSSPYHTKEFNYRELSSLLKKEFKSVKILGQTKSVKAKKAWGDFLKSQGTRQGFVEKDKFGIRKMVPKSVKEKIWKYLGNFYGRESQEKLETKDFPIKRTNVQKSYYFIAICRK